jgi:hypothetical protein
MLEVDISVFRSRGRRATCLRSTTACSEVWIEAVACSEAGDEAAACYEARIEDERRRRHDSV